jgi:hypothetical protein
LVAQESGDSNRGHDQQPESSVPVQHVPVAQESGDSNRGHDQQPETSVPVQHVAVAQESGDSNQVQHPLAEISVPIQHGPAAEELGGGGSSQTTSSAPSWGQPYVEAPSSRVSDPRIPQAPTEALTQSADSRIVHGPTDVGTHGVDPRIPQGTIDSHGVSRTNGPGSVPSTGAGGSTWGIPYAEANAQPSIDTRAQSSYEPASGHSTWLSDSTAKFGDGSHGLPGLEHGPGNGQSDPGAAIHNINKGQSEPADPNTTTHPVGKGQSEPADPNTTTHPVGKGQSEPADPNTTTHPVGKGQSEPADPNTTTHPVGKGQSDPPANNNGGLVASDLTSSWEQPGQAHHTSNSAVPDGDSDKGHDVAQHGNIAGQAGERHSHSGKDAHSAPHGAGHHAAAHSADHSTVHSTGHSAGNSSSEHSVRLPEAMSGIIADGSVNSGVHGPLSEGHRPAEWVDGTASHAQFIQNNSMIADANQSALSGTERTDTSHSPAMDGWIVGVDSSGHSHTEHGDKRGVDSGFISDKPEDPRHIAELDQSLANYIAANYVDETQISTDSSSSYTPLEHASDFVQFFADQERIERERRDQQLLDDENLRLADTKAKDEAHREQERLRLEQEAKDKKLSDEMATMLALRQQAEAEAKMQAQRLLHEKIQKEEEVRKDNLQEKYKVRKTDTIDGIAKTKFGDVRIADLIYELNKDKIQVRWVNGKRVYVVEEGAILLLPSKKQVREWTAKMNGVTSVQSKTGLKAQQSVDDSERRSNIERVLGKLKESSDQEGKTYSVRLGDTLRSIAMKHPDMRDVTLWKLLAYKNGLSTDTDSKGAPLSVLIRGSSLVIPSKEEIEAYKLAYNSGRSAAAEKPATTMASMMLDIAADCCGRCSRLVNKGTLVCPTCGFVFALPEKSMKEQVEATFVMPDGDTTLSLPEQQQTLVTEPQQSEQLAPLVQDEVERNPQEVTTIVDFDKSTLPPVQSPRLRNQGIPTKPITTNLDLAQRSSEERARAAELSREVEVLSDNCRLVKSERELADARFYCRQLEVRSGDEWFPILVYEVGSDSSVRHEYSKDGRKKTVKIDLPGGAVGEMVENEITRNWRDYCSRFLSGKRLSV